MNTVLPELNPNIDITQFDEREGEKRYLVQLEHLNFIVNLELNYVIQRILAIQLNQTIDTCKEIDTLTITQLMSVAIEHLPNELFKGAEIVKQRPPFIISTIILPKFILQIITKPLGLLYHPKLMISLFSLFVIVHASAMPLLLSSDINLIEREDFILLIILFFTSCLIHEIGHASACSRFGEEHGSIGIGIYFIFPIFYADVTNAWRIKKFERALVDIGGIYFQAVSLIIIDIWILVSGSNLASILSFIVTFTMLHTLNPFFKFDGYWLLSDLSGITNLHEKVRTTVKYYSRKLLNVKTTENCRPHEKAVLIPYTILTLSFIAYLTSFLISKLSKYSEELPPKLISWNSNFQTVSEFHQLLDSLLNLMMIAGFPVLIFVGVTFYFKKMFHYFF